MKVTALAIPDVLLFEPKVFGDERGFFFESFNQQRFNAATGLDLQFVQDNHSKSAKGVLRGLHYQLPPKAQGKLVRVVAGEVFDGSVKSSRATTSASCGFRPGWRTALLCSVTRPSFSTKPRITTRRKWNAASAGMIRIWPSTGRLEANQCCQGRMRWAGVFPGFDINVTRPAEDAQAHEFAKDTQRTHIRAWSPCSTPAFSAPQSTSRTSAKSGKPASTPSQV